jgi:hypothetical protein
MLHDSNEQGDIPNKSREPVALISGPLRSNYILSSLKSFATVLLLTRTRN